MLFSKPHTKDYLHGASRLASLMLQAYSNETGEQCIRVSKLAVCIGQAMLLDEPQIMALRYGAMLHDIGKVRVSRSILEKDGPLTPAEYEVVKRHPEDGYNILTAGQYPISVALIALQHHEKYDGTGYPFGLSGQGIRMEARVFSVADTYDAIVNDRCYRKARSHGAAVKEIMDNAFTQFDPSVVTAFIQIPATELILDDEELVWQ